MNLNTVIAPVYWELMEPIEGQFDFSLVDSLIKNARLFNMKLVIYGLVHGRIACPAMRRTWVKDQYIKVPENTG
jgi:hypothetical protein